MHADIASRSCADCQRFMYTDSPGPPVSMGEVRRDPKGKPYPRIGKPPCWYCPKQPSGLAEGDRTPETAVELSDRNWLAYQHYTECKAVGQFPADWLVKRNAATIAGAESVANQVQQLQLAILRGTRS
jgi:hypothetical protein